MISIVGCGSDASPTRPLSQSPTPPAPGAMTYTVSGTVTAAAGSAVDSDSNDPNAPPVSNDTPATAQALPNPVVLGGYVTAVATGATIADSQDWYRMTLGAGQTITLTIADHDGDALNAANPDLDLFLVNPSNLGDVQTSEGLGRQEVINVLTGGDYYVQVFSFTAGTNYTLSVGQSPAAIHSAALRIEDEFVPGELIVRFRDPAPVPGVVPLSLADRAKALGLIPRAGRPGTPMLYHMSAAATAYQTQSMSAAGKGSKAVGTAMDQAKRATINQVKSLRRRTDVASADLNYIRRPLLIPDDPLYLSSPQWNLSLINLPLAWDTTTGSAAVVVALVDSGVLMNHPDLAGRLCSAADGCSGYDFVANVTSAADGDGIDADPEDPSDAHAFHGTHVAGIVGAAGNNTLGVAGVDWTAKLMPVRVIGVAVGNSYDIMQGVRYAAGLSNDSLTVPAKAANILNLSLGGGGYSQAEQDLFAELRTKGIIVVAAAGNDASGIPIYPAAYAGVVAVSAVDRLKNLAPYSNFGASIDVAAPGGGTIPVSDGVLSTSGTVLTTVVDYNYLYSVGTSMASPHVAGVAALMRAVDPALTPAQFDVLLAAGSLTEDLGGDGANVRNDSFGYGLIDAQKSVLAALNLAGGGPLPAALAVNPGYLNFGATDINLPLTLSNVGGGTLTITNVDFSAVPWITGVTLVGESPPGSGLGNYAVTVSRSGLADGNHTGTITFTTGGDVVGSTIVTVFIQVGAFGTANTGRHTIYLLDAAGVTRLQSVSAVADPGNGTYSYSFAGIAPGSYRVAAGSDLDHDDQICDPGEACGRYPLLTAPALINVTSANRTGIDFSSSFDANQR